MLDRRAALMFATIFCLWITSVAYGQEQDLKTLKASQDLVALKANFEAEIDALNSRKLEATLAPVDDRMILFGIFSPFPIEGKEGFRQAVQEYFDNYEQAVFRPIEPDFKIIGTTGVAWGNFRLATKLKNGPLYVWHTKMWSENGRRSLPYSRRTRRQDRRAGCARHHTGLAPSRLRILVYRSYRVR